MPRPPTPYRLKKVTEVLYLGADGRAAHKVTQLTVAARLPVTAIVYLLDTSDAEVHGVVGCEAGGPYPDEHTRGLTAVELTLDEPLGPGGEVALEFHTFFHTSSPADALWFDGGASGVQDVELRVVFKTKAPPPRIWWQRASVHDASDPIILDRSPRDIPPGLIEPRNPGAGFYANLTWVCIQPENRVGLYWQWR